MNWFRSGITNSFRFERVGFDLETSLGFVEGVTEGKISRDYDGDYKASLQLEFDGEPIPDSSLIRVWHDASIGDELETRELGTFMLKPSSSNYEKGRNVGTANGYSLLFALDRDKRGTDRVMKAGAGIVALFEQIVTAAHCVPYVDPTIDASKTLSSSHVWEFGQSVLHECNVLANALGAIIRPDTHGRVCLLPYIEPAKRPRVFSLGADEYVDGIQFESPETRNRVSLRYTYDNNGEQTVIFSTATVSPEHPFSWQRIGRNDSEVFDVENLSQNTQSALDAMAATYLRQQTGTARFITASSPFFPIEDGTAGTFVLGSEVITGVISQLSIDLNPVMLQTLGFKEVA